MERFEKILFVSQSGAVDGPSLERIFALARSGGASVTLAGVVEYSAADFGAIPQGVAPQQLLQLLADERRDQLERLCAAAPPGVRSEVVVLNGIPYLEIIRKVLRDGHDLVVKPVVQEIGLRARLFGSLDLHLLRKCPVPLWLMRPAAAGGPERVLAAVDMGHDSDGEIGRAHV
jgi:nucleotide-binding universal stress UspA family protein